MGRKQIPQQVGHALCGHGEFQIGIAGDDGLRSDPTVVVAKTNCKMKSRLEGAPKDHYLVVERSQAKTSFGRKSVPYQVKWEVKLMILR
jgi:hypothetical protein